MEEINLLFDEEKKGERLPLGTPYQYPSLEKLEGALDETHWKKELQSINPDPYNSSFMDARIDVAAMWDRSSLKIQYAARKSKWKKELEKRNNVLPTYLQSRLADIRAEKADIISELERLQELQERGTVFAELKKRVPPQKVEKKKESHEDEQQ